MKDYVYITQEIEADRTISTYNGLPMMGVGETNKPQNRFNQLIRRGSKGSAGLDLILHVKTKNSDTEIHKILIRLGFTKLKRHNMYLGEKSSTRTELFSGTSKITIKDIVNKGDTLSVELLKKIITNSDPDAFKLELILKPHQKEAYDFMLERFNSGAKNVLLNHKSRSGKSFIAYEFLINNPYNIKNVLLLTQIPYLNKQWKREFENLIGHNYEIINFSDLDEDYETLLKSNKPKLIMVSLQDAKGTDGVSKSGKMLEFLDKNKFEVIKNIIFDLIIFDEIHKGKETEQTDFLLENLDYKKLLGLSATPTKNILRGTFEKENINVYDLITENEYKKKYGTKIYDLPEIKFNLLELDEIKEELQYFKEEENLTFKKFFRVDDIDGVKQLHYYDDIQLFFKMVFGVGNRFSDNALDNIIGRAHIRNILIFVENNDSLKLLKECLNDIGRKFNNYDIYYTNSKVNNSNGLSKMIDDIDEKPGKSIIFANRQLTTGITLKKCDVVMFMNDWKSMDEYMQASYRCQSPSTSRKVRFTNVFDFNPSRTFNIFYEYIKYSTINSKEPFNELHTN